MGKDTKDRLKMALPKYADGGETTGIPYKDHLDIYNISSKWNKLLDASKHDFNLVKKNADKFYASPEGAKLNDLLAKYNIRSIDDPTKVIPSPVEGSTGYSYSRFNAPVDPSTAPQAATLPIADIIPDPASTVVDPNWTFKAKKFTPAAAPQIPTYSGEIVNTGYGIVAPEYKDGGPVNYGAGGKSYGMVPGNGNPKADDKVMMAKEGHVVPAEYAHIAMKLVKMMGLLIMNW